MKPMELEYRLKMQAPNHKFRYLRYQPHQSKLFWEDDSKPVSMEHLGYKYSNEKKDWKEFPTTSPMTPVGKIHDIRKLKIQLGLKCNYSCQYCSQGGFREGQQGKIADVESFLAQLSSWFDGGSDKKGKDVVIEFWGGEPFVYWNILKPLGLKLREKYPNAKFIIITNASLLDLEKIDWIEQINVGIGISHDGPAYAEARGADPLYDPKKKEMILELYRRRNPKGMISFNCVMTKNNRSFRKVREHIATALGVDGSKLSIGTEEILLPYDIGGLALSPKTEAEHSEIIHEIFWEAVQNYSMDVSAVKQKCQEFFNSIANSRPSFSLGQKCGMDRPNNIAVDLKGNVLTCQNTNAESKHKIGTVSEFDKIKLTTSWHWSKRNECNQCPVVQLCQGSCMYNEGKYWEQSCDNSFTWNSALMAVALYYITRMVLIEIEGDVIRRESLPSKISVIKLKDGLPEERFRLRPHMQTPTEVTTNV